VFEVVLWSGPDGGMYGYNRRRLSSVLSTEMNQSGFDHNLRSTSSSSKIAEFDGSGGGKNPFVRMLGNR
jgi:hypothetical protein